MFLSRFSFSISSRISIIPCGSRPFIGSSSTTRSGSPHSAIAIPSLCFMPREKFFAFFLPVSTSPTRSSSSSIPSVFGRPSTLYCCMRFSLAVRSRYMAGVSTTAPIRLLDFTISLSSFFMPNISKPPSVGL